MNKTLNLSLSSCHLHSLFIYFALIGMKILLQDFHIASSVCLFVLPVCFLFTLYLRRQLCLHLSQSIFKTVYKIGIFFFFLVDDQHPNLGYMGFYAKNIHTKLTNVIYYDPLPFLTPFNRAHSPV